MKLYRRFAFCLMFHVALAVLLTGAPSKTAADCPEGFGELDPEPNVLWTFRDSVAACPAGDSLMWSTHPFRPSQLRILISYMDSNCDPKVGVPPESIYVVTENYSGNAVANDQPKVYADNATDANGVARVTVRSLSGAGRIKFRVFVSGIEQGGYSTPYVRTIDTNADGRVTSADATGMADINYNGITIELDELAILGSNIDHWHRNALYGTPVTRTAFPAYEYGEGYLTWEPNQRSVAYGAHHGCNDDCVIDTLSTTSGSPIQFTFPGCREDYDPAWSPRGHEIVFSRASTSIMRKGIAPPDTAEILIAYTPDSVTTRYSDSDLSPNSRKVVFAAINAGTSTGNLFTVGISGDSLTQITNLTTTAVRWPRWSADGQWIYFGLLVDSDFAIYKVPSIGGSVVLVDSSDGRHEQYPHNSPDGAIVLLAHLGITGSNKYTATIDPSLANPQPIRNYENHPSSYAMFPTFGPDGTRVAFVGKPSLSTANGDEQILITRRNMSLPPTLSAIGDRVVEENDELTFTVSATDPEGDALTYAAFYLESGMSFSPSTRVFSWTPGAGAVGRSFWVVFRASTPSGGVDKEVVKVSVIEDGFRSAQLASTKPVFVDRTVGGSILLTAEGGHEESASLEIYSVSGRLVGRVNGRGGSQLGWDGRDHNGRRVPAGVYLYRMRVGAKVSHGKVVFVR